MDSGELNQNEDKVNSWLSSMAFQTHAWFASKGIPPPAKRMKVESGPKSLCYPKEKECHLWHTPNNRKSKPTYNKPCKRLYSALEKKLSKPSSPSLKIAWTKDSSKYPISYLSPTSAEVRRKSIKIRKNILNMKSRSF